MPELIVAVTQKCDEETVRSMVGKYVHATRNEHIMRNLVDSSEVVENVWFAGRVAGLERTEVYYDWVDDRFIETPEVHLTVMLADGSGWLLSKTALEINSITEEEFQEMLAQHAAAQAVSDAINNPVLSVPEDKKILLMGRDF